MYNKVEMIEADLTKTAIAKQDVESRLKQAVTDQEDAKRKYESLRSERQTALAANKKVTVINSNLKQAQESLELAEDAATGLNNELARLTNDREILIKDHTAAVLNHDTEELKALAVIYNTQAEQLAKTVREIFEVRRRLKEDPMHSRVVNAVPGWGRNALEIIPKLYFAGEEIPNALTKQAFFNANFQ
jgi:chromosome segregation ATPase